MDVVALLKQNPSAQEPWVEYRIYRDLMDESEDDPRVKVARAKMIAHPLIAGLMAEMTEWPGIVLNSHKSAGQLYHKLVFLADLGLNKYDGDLIQLEAKMMNTIGTEGVHQLPMNIPTHFGGSGKDELAWALCDAPIQMVTALKMGLISMADAAPGIAYLDGLCRKNGWPCAASQSLGKFRGPGRKEDPCPYATLIMLKLMLLLPEYYTHDSVRAGVESLLFLWENSLTEHPYIFYMGNDFRKLKAPFIWYDILHIADVLSQFSWARSDARFLDMMDVIRKKQGIDGLYTPESIWQAWKGWDFAQKKQPSIWLSFLVARIEHRLAQTTPNNGVS